MPKVTWSGKRAQYPQGKQLNLWKEPWRSNNLIPPISDELIKYFMEVYITPEAMLKVLQDAKNTKPGS